MSLQTAISFNVTGKQPYIGNPIGNPIFPGYTVRGNFYYLAILYPIMVFSRSDMWPHQ